MKIRSSALTLCFILAIMNNNTVLASEEVLNSYDEVSVEINKEKEDVEINKVATRGVSEKNNVRDKFRLFYLYGPSANPTIDLSNKDSIIKTYSQANTILKKTKDGNPTDRQKYLDAWNSLTTKEKSSADMKEIDTSYKNIITISTGAKSVLKFYEDVKANKDILINDSKKANELNSKSNENLGARGKAYNDYTKATKIESKSKSKRVAYLNEKYLDAVYFLNVSKYLSTKNIDSAIKEANKIKDKTLSETAIKAIEKNSTTKKQENVIKRFKQFYLYGSQSNPTIDLTNKASLIKTYKQATGLLELTKSDGTKADRKVFLDAYNELSDTEKESPQIKEIIAQYEDMITILEAAESTLKFYEDVKANANELIYNFDKSIKLNDKNNLTQGARGKAYENYTKATKIESKSKSKRVAYLNEKYLDGVYFLNVSKYISQKNTDKALAEVEKIKDSTLKKVANNAVYDSLENEFIITPDSPTFKNNMMNRPSYNESTKHYYLIRSYLEELDNRGGGTLTLKEGTYKITNSLYVPSNTTIILDGATLVKSSKTDTDALTPSRSIFQLISPSNNSSGVKFGKYEGEKNIKIIGKNNATLNLSNISDSIGIVIGHNDGVEVSGLNFTNMNGGHFIELDASKNVTIKNNTFKDSKAYGNLSKEAINLDTPDKATEGWDSTWTKYDKTPNLNVYIENNLFSNLDRAIGTHKYSEGKYHTNVQIRNNTIEKTRSDSIRMLNWKDAIIENNTIKDIQSDKTNVRGILGGGVINPTIKNNTFKNMPRAMQFFPAKNSGAGSSYNTTYNDISEKNKVALSENTINNVEESFVRINEEFDVFTNPIKVYFK